MDNNEWQDGIPPVGCECEYNTAYKGDKEKWEKVFIIAHDNKRAVFYICDEPFDEKGHEYYSNDKDFRPLKTPDQQQREDAIEAMLNIVLCKSKNMRTCGTVEALYDADYRKMGEEVKPDELSDFINPYIQADSLAVHLKLLKHFHITKRGE